MTDQARAGEEPSVMEVLVEAIRPLGFTNDVVYLTAAVVLVALRDLPVEQRMEAMGMQKNTASFDGGMTWEDVWTDD